MTGAAAGVALAAMLACGGHAAPKEAVRDVSLARDGAEGHRAVSQAELQEDLQRLTGQFFDRIAQAQGELEAAAPGPAIEDEALRMTLAYSAAVLDIATEPLPEVGVLDMAVFLGLGRRVLADHWVPEVYGKPGRAFLDAFVRTEEELSTIVSKITSDAQRAELVEAIETFRRENPDQVRIAGLRLTDFSKRAGTVASERAQATQGLLSSVKGATQSADQAVLLAQRGLFLVHRMPFLLRLQMRLGSRQMLGDALEVLGSTDAVARSVGHLAPTLRQLPPLVDSSVDAVREVRLLVQDIKPLLEDRDDEPSSATPDKPDKGARIERSLASANELTKNANDLLHQIRESIEGGPDSTLARGLDHVDGLMKRAVLYLVLLGAAWSILWWGGYVLAKRTMRRDRPRRRERRRSESAPSPAE